MRVSSLAYRPAAAPASPRDEAQLAAQVFEVDDVLFRGVHVPVQALDEPEATGTPRAPVPSPAEGRIARHLGWGHAQRPGDELIRRSISWTWKVKLSLSLERDLFARLREEAEAVAIKVFGDNVRDLLLAE